MAVRDYALLYTVEFICSRDYIFRVYCHETESENICPRFLCILWFLVHVNVLYLFRSV